MPDQDPLNLHANAVAVQGRGLLIKGGSGSGKSGLTLSLMALGASLVADDRTIVSRSETGLNMAPHPELAGLIEARGIGLLHAEFASTAQMVAVLDLDHEECDRLPPDRDISLLGVTVPLLFNFSSPYFPAGLIQFLKGGRRDT
ncbi:HPr kinase/phosphorylase [Pelagimonas phthalicica]|uniref:HPr kinase/phosphorylase n=1 Tax=Pelagimonas phthalicica TaxID=1037362 RepID=A0A238JHJ7_9RHOB|nr:serine kinase [Pelagimonas phthalicica]TDS89141.1 Hpr(Ser) kinase/phosphatase [Pelagimonas phthalicica]SMX29684.1 HPr kinase/phosphorylase [Pelagimonas phthalicica]